jgi:hypothetical protein
VRVRNGLSRRRLAITSARLALSFNHRRICFRIQVRSTARGNLVTIVFVHSIIGIRIPPIKMCW